MKQDAELLAFVHIPKTGGTTWTGMLRRHFGHQHLDVALRPGTRVYRARDLRVDLRFLPWVRSLSGHPLQPHVSYEETGRSLRWSVMLRDPIKRFISQYQHEVERHKRGHDFLTWMRTFNRANFQVRWLAGEQNLQRAIDILEEKMCCVGLLEHFDESVALLRHSLKLQGMDLSYGRPSNQARKGNVRRRLEDRWEEYASAAEENNALDRRLYEYAEKVVWPRQLKVFGEEQLADNLKIEQTVSPPRTVKVRTLLWAAQRYGFYKPIARVDSWLTGSGWRR